MKRITMMWVTGLFIVGLIIQYPQSASAKLEPYIEDQAREWGDVESPFELPYATAFYGLFGHLGVYGDVDAFTFDFTEPSEEWMMNLMVPQCGVHYEPFFPTMALIGQGLDTPEENVLPFSIPEDMGAVVYTDANQELPRELDRGDLLERRWYRNTPHFVDIPQAGRYTLVVWEPNGHVGAYGLLTGNEHPQMSEDRADEREAVYNQLWSDEWLGVDCDEMPIVESCPLTEGQTVVSLPSAPERTQIGEGYTLTGVVRDAETCLPIAEAQILAEVANEDGQYDADHNAMLHTNRQGAFQLHSMRPANVGTAPQIVVSVIAEGYIGIVSTHQVDETADSGHIAINLRPISR